MFEVKYNPNVPKQDHHEFIYDKGQKIPKPEPKVCFAYIDKGDFFHATIWEDDASKYGEGVYAVTDEIKCDDGFPIVNGKKYKVCGADEYSVKLSKDGDERFHVKEEQVGNKIIVPHGDEQKMADLDVIREMYLKIEAKKAEVK